MAQNFNICQKWGLFCTECKEITGGVQLRCMLNGKKKADGNYQKGVPITVVCILNPQVSSTVCDIPQDNYDKCYVDVDGYVSASEWVDKNGVAHGQLSIFATKVRKHEWNNQPNTQNNAPRYYQQ